MSRYNRLPWWWVAIVVVMFLATSWYWWGQYRTCDAKGEGWTLLKNAWGYPVCVYTGGPR